MSQQVVKYWVSNLAAANSDAFRVTQGLCWIDRGLNLTSPTLSGPSRSIGVAYLAVLTRFSRLGQSKVIEELPTNR